MKISNSKKQLAQIIHANGGWVDGAEWATQDKTPLEVGFWLDSEKPHREPFQGGIWVGSGWSGSSNSIKCADSQLIKNWHQTILSREEYFHLYPVPDAGASRWAQVYAASEPDSPTSDKYAKPEQSLGSSIGREKFASGNIDTGSLVGVPTIEQLAADYRNRKDYADRKQQEADAAKADAEAKLAELVAAGKALGLVLSVAAPELAITDVGGLLVGDEVRCVNPNGGLVEPDSLGVVVGVSGDRFFTDFPEQRRYVYLSSHLKRGDVVFVRRPAKGGADA